MSALIIHPGTGTVIDASECHLMLTEGGSDGFIERLLEGDADAHESVRRLGTTLADVLGSPEMAAEVFKQL